MNKIIKEGQDFGYKGNRPGFYDEKGNWSPIDTKTFPKSDLEKLEQEYIRRRGQAQIQKDLELHKKTKAEQEARRKAEAEAKAKAKAKDQPPAGTAQPPAGTAQPPRTGQAPSPTRQPAPQSSPVAKYMAAAAAARKSGDPAEMAKVRDQGLAIWRDKYKDTLAKKVSPTGQQLGTGQSEMSKQAAELRALRPVKTPEAPASAQPTVKTDTAAQRVQAAQEPKPEPIRLEVKPFNPTNLGGSKVKGTSTRTLAASYEYDAYDLVLEYLLSEGHADTVEEAHYVMMQMDSEYIQDVIQERWSWNPMDWGKAEATPKNLAREKPALGYNPNTGTTNMGNEQSGYRPQIMASRGGVAGTMIKGKPETWTRVNISDPRVKDAYERYRTLRGTAQLNKDAKNNAYVSATNKAFDAKYADVYKNSGAEREGLGPRPTAPAPKPVAKPQPPTVQSKNVTATGTSYERRTPTSAELAAARAAGGGEAGVKAAVDVAKSNKVAATTPTPDLKPEVPNKRESLASQLDDLVKMRKSAEERNKGTN